MLGLSIRAIIEEIYAGWIRSREIGNSRLIPAAWPKPQQTTKPNKFSGKLQNSIALKRHER